MSWSSTVAGWFSRALGSRSDEPAPERRPLVLATGADAVVSTEASFSDGLLLVGRGRGVDANAVRSTDRTTNGLGRSIALSELDSESAAFGQAMGLSMSGLRATLLLYGDGLARLQHGLHAAAGQKLPLVAHVACRALPRHASTGGSGHASYHAAADTGAFLAFARSAQHAVDLALVARRVAEMGLLPGIVAMDGPETAWAVQDLSYPSEGLVGDYVGDPSAEVDCPTTAQTLLFGARRRRLPRRFDPDHPAALGPAQSGQDYGLGSVGHKTFFSNGVVDLIESAMADLAKRTGRPLSLVSKHGPDAARLTVVAQGSALETLEAVADNLPKAEKKRIRIVGIDWLRPLPVKALRAALANAEAVTVLERFEADSLGPGPLMREVSCALGAEAPHLLSARYGLGGLPFTADHVATLFDNVLAGDRARPHIRLGAAPPTTRTSFPKREVLLEALLREYPELTETALEEARSPGVVPEAARTVAVCFPAGEAPADALARAATEASAVVGPHVRGRTESEERTWVGRVTVAPDPIADPGDHPPLHAVVASDPGAVPRELASRLADGGRLVVATGLSPDALWARLPGAWREARKDSGRKLELLVVNGSSQDAFSAIPSALRAEGASDQACANVDVAKLAEPSLPEEETGSAMVRPTGSSEPRFDDLARFWGEVAQPRLGEGGRDAVADPYLAVGAAPVRTATLGRAVTTTDVLPVVDASRCTGCSRCWTACPDSAIAVTASSSAALLDTAAEIATERGAARNPIADKLERAHKQLGARLDSQLAKNGERSITPQALDASFDWLIEKMSPADEEGAAMRELFDRTVGALDGLPLAATESFFHGPHKAKKGSGVVLAFAVNPDTCKGCGGCAAVCPDDAIELVARDPATTDAARRGWRRIERMPDTSGTTIERAARDPDVGPLGGALMSRHCSLALSGRDGAEPGSGERLALRLACGAVEYHMQRRALEHLGAMEELAARLQEAVRASIAAALPVDDLGVLDRALGEVPDRPGNLADLAERLEKLESRPTVKVARARDLVRTAEDVTSLRWKVAKGVRGVGRARFGLVLAGESLRAWAASYARCPFGAPVAADLAEGGADLALGLAKGLVAHRVEEARLLRRAQLLLDSPSDLPDRNRALASLGWRDLTEDERLLCPPLLLVVGSEPLAGRLLGEVMGALSAQEPVKVLVLDGRSPGAPDPLPFAVGLRSAYVAASSISHPDQLDGAVAEALGFPGPALIHVYSPSPHRHGFATDQTIARASLAVDSRVHPLFTYDPRREGAFGTCLDLGGNPQPRAPWVQRDDDANLTPADFAAGEERFEPLLSDPGRPLDAWIEDRARYWATLQELAGIVTPFTDAVRAEAEREVQEAHAAEIEALENDHARRLEEVKREHEAAQAARLRERLLDLAGYGAAPGKRRREDDPS